jgi:hypothetical protein
VPWPGAAVADTAPPPPRPRAAPLLPSTTAALALAPLSTSAAAAACAALGAALGIFSSLVGSLPCNLAAGAAPYITGLEPLLDGIAASQRRRGSAPCFPAFVVPTWIDVVASLSAPPPVSSALAMAIATIQAVVAASRDREHAVTLALEHERAMGAALTA